MSYSISLSTNDTQVSREENDFYQYREFAEEQSDDEVDDFLDTPVLNALVRAGTAASHLKTRFSTALAKAGLRQPSIDRDPETGNCKRCGGMDGVAAAFQHIELAAKAGCPSCGILAAGLRHYIRDEKLLSNPRLSVSTGWNSGCAGRQFIRTKHKSSRTTPGAMGVEVLLEQQLTAKDLFTDWRTISGTVVGEFNIFGTKDDPASWDTVGLARNISGDTSSQAAFLWFQAQLEACVTEHKACQPLVASSNLPIRLLDLACPTRTEGPSEDHVNGGIRLCENNGQADRYVCLSYCWGGTIDIRLTKDRYEAYNKNISWSTLPRGYRDAIILTRKLGIRYIWIDSLCIVQDDTEDWRRQASLMASIFQGAYVTIAGTKARNPMEGYFSSSPPAYKATRIEHEDSTGVKRHAYIRETLPHFFSSTASKQTDYTGDDFPLLQRGWVFQERLLSPRILHLGDAEMAWECNETCACECIGETMTYESEPRWALTKGGYVWNLTAAIDEEEIYPEWRTIVADYTRTALTYDKDVFPAISGIVKDMQRFRTDRYVAGVWENSILEDLAWITLNNQQPRPTEWRAPSWSWASVLSPVTYKNLRTMLPQKYLQESPPAVVQTTLLETSITPAGQDEAAEILSAHIVLSGPLNAAKFELSTKPTKPGWNHVVAFGASRLPFEPDYDLSAPGEAFVPSGSSVFLFHLYYERNLKVYEKWERKNMRSFALVLRKVCSEGSATRSAPGSCSDEPEDGTYERIGILTHDPSQEEGAGYMGSPGTVRIVRLV